MTDLPALFSFAQIFTPARPSYLISYSKKAGNLLGFSPALFPAVGCFFETVLLQSNFYRFGNIFRFFIFLRLLSLAALLF